LAPTSPTTPETAPVTGWTCHRSTKERRCGAIRQEDFRRSAISAESRHRAGTAGANFDFSGGKIRLMANYVSRKIGEPGVRRGTLIAQAQVKF
jgi:hypothetical protein